MDKDNPEDVVTMSTVTDIQGARRARSAKEVHDVQDMREALMGQLLADIDTLITRLEALTAAVSGLEGKTAQAITEAITRSTANLEEMESKAANRIIMEAGKAALNLRQQIHQEGAEMLDHMHRLTEESRACAVSVHQDRRWFATAIWIGFVVTGLAGGIIGAVLASGWVIGGF